MPGVFQRDNSDPLRALAYLWLRRELDAVDRLITHVGHIEIGG